MSAVTILLATYNGKQYVEQMIESIISQDFTDWKLILSDDGSTDGTAEILESYAEKMPEKIVHYKSGKRFGNAQNHFMHLLEQFHNTPYIMFCDQDDVWHPDKISKTFARMKEIEKDPSVPALVHTDLRVVDSNLVVLDNSFMHFSKLEGKRMSLKQLLVQNVVTGCTMMINNALANVAVQSVAKANVVMHDWWLALIASAYEQTGFWHEPTIDYRQHNNNVVGAKNIRSAGYIINKIRSTEIRAAMENTFKQAAEFEKCFNGIIPENKFKIVSNYAKLGAKRGLFRKVGYIRHGFWKIGLTRKIAQLLMG